MCESKSPQHPSEPADASATDAEEQKDSSSSDSKVESRVKIVFISGQQGSGKSALAEALFSCATAKKQHPRVVLFDGDVWALGYDPTIGPNPPPESKVKDDTPFRERMTAISAFLAEFRSKGREEEATDDADEDAYQDEKHASSWQPFYAAMCEDALRVGAKQLQQANDDSESCVVLITHAVYRRSMRLFVKSQLGDRLARWIFVDPSPKLAIQRAAERCAKQYAAMGKSAEEWARLLEPNSAGFQRPSTAELDALGGADTGKVAVLENKSQDLEHLKAVAQDMLADNTLFCPIKVTISVFTRTPQSALCSALFRRRDHELVLCDASSPPWRSDIDEQLHVVPPPLLCLGRPRNPKPYDSSRGRGALRTGVRAQESAMPCGFRV